MNEKKSVKEFKRKYKLKEINRESLSAVLEKQGFTIIPFGRYTNSGSVDFLITALRVTEYIQSCCCFTYQDEKYRLVFLNEELADEEAAIVLAHEEGHIWHEHTVQEAVFGNHVKQEFQANEFAHYLLKNDRNQKRYRRCAAVLVLCMTFLVWGKQAKLSNDEKIYTENYYRTEAGKKYHLENCIYIKSKNNVEKLTKEEYESGEYEPCVVCIPLE